MFNYLSADIESTVVLNWATIANIGVSLGLTTFCLHSRGSSSKYWKYLTLSLSKLNSVAIQMGSDKYRIESPQAAASSWNTSSVTRVSVKLRNVKFDSGWSGPWHRYPVLAPYPGWSFRWCWLGRCICTQWIFCINLCRPRWCFIEISTCRLFFLWSSIGVGSCDDCYSRPWTSWAKWVGVHMVGLWRLCSSGWVLTPSRPVF